MPELDAVTMATPAEGARVELRWPVPADWPAGRYEVAVEVNTEGDYNARYDPESFPTPTAPDESWDPWARSYGYPYRGQPSVIYALTVELPPTDTRADPSRVTSSQPTEMGTLDGSLETRAVDDSPSPTIPAARRAAAPIVSSCGIAPGCW